MIIDPLDRRPAAEVEGRVKLPADFRQRRDRFWEREQQLTAQRSTRERLRYRQYVRCATLWGWMQRLGDFGRKYLPFIGRGGWDGIGGRGGGR